MLHDLTLDTFAPLVGQEFALHLDGSGTLPLTLIQARSTVEEGDTRRLRAPFALLFRGPLGQSYAQRTYRLDNATLGTVEIFLVPIQPNAEGTLYEAIFG
ncbi:MAG TPA: hypothetical protein VE913_11300 [Longimicrobium sp.]|nr:hypothetical protein [Longimicrobium sp.]